MWDDLKTPFHYFQMILTDILEKQERYGYDNDLFDYALDARDVLQPIPQQETILIQYRYVHNVGLNISEYGKELGPI